MKRQQKSLAAKEAKLKAQQGSVQPLLELIPEVEGGDISLLERIKSASGQLTQYITEMS